jgi:hypothetical protein
MHKTMLNGKKFFLHPLLLLLISLYPAIQETSAQNMHSDWHDLLEQFVDDQGYVNYKSWHNEGMSTLDAYLDQLCAYDIDQLKNDRDAHLAFWLNTYNAFTIKLILDHYPVTSIKDIHNGSPWDVDWIMMKQGPLSLNDIENNIIRPVFKDPRIHFAVNCAAKSCPPLMNRAFTGNNVQHFLSKRTTEFINDEKFNHLSSGSIELSKIFEWYVSDFTPLLPFINTYATTAVSNSAVISYKTYNWALNGQ